MFQLLQFGLQDGLFIRMPDLYEHLTTAVSVLPRSIECGFYLFLLYCL